MVFAEDIRKTILRLADERGPNHSFCTADVAQQVDRENWQMLLEQVRFVASVLVQEGKIIIEGQPDAEDNESRLMLRKAG